MAVLFYGGLTATTRIGICDDDLKVRGNDIFGTLTEPCAGSGGGVIRQCYDSSGDGGADVARQFAWSGRFMQVGRNAQWHNHVGLLNGVYLFHSLRRNNVDNILVVRGNPLVHQNHPLVHQNHPLMLEAAYKWQPNESLFMRAQVSSNLYFNDLPVTYNASTSGSFGSGYPVVTIGQRAGS